MKKTTFITLASVLIFFIFAAPSYSKGVYILCYHAFLEKKDPYSFTNEIFREQLHKLKNSGFTFVTFEDVINDKITGNKNILISIDDGNKSVYQAYYSIMKPMEIKPLLGIYPAIISRMHYAMTWDEVKQLSADGCYIASHGYHHMFLSEKYYNQEPASFKKEIYLSKKILEEKLNRKIETMLYPFGVNSPIAINELKNAGYKYAMTIEPRMESLPSANNFQIHRYLMTKTGYKGIIAHIIKQSGAAVAENSQTPSNNLQVNNPIVTEQKNTGNAEQISIIDYPGRIKKILSDNTKFIPDITQIKTNKHGKKFKPFVHTSKTPAELRNTNKKISSKNEKKNQRKKKTA